MTDVMTYTAFAVTGHTAQGGEIPGVYVLSDAVDDAGAYLLQDDRWQAASGDLSATWGMCDDLTLDAEAADAELTKLGWRRTGEWTIAELGGWQADVEPIQALPRERQYLTSRQAAARAGIDRDSVRQLVRRARAAGVELHAPGDVWPDERTPLIDAAALDTYLQRRARR